MNRSAILFVFSQITIVLLLWQIWGEETLAPTTSSKNYTKKIVEGKYSAPEQAPPEKEEKGKEEVDWIDKTLPEVSFRGPEGSISPKDFMGTPLVLEFMSTECPYCQNMAPLFARIVPGSGAEMLSVSIAGDTMEDMREWHNNFLSKPMPGFYAIEEDSRAKNLFAIRGTPTTFFIDAKGKVRALAEGEFAEKDLRRLLDYIVGKDAPKEPAAWLPMEDLE